MLLDVSFEIVWGSIYVSKILSLNCVVLLNVKGGLVCNGSFIVIKEVRIWPLKLICIGQLPMS